MTESDVVAELDAWIARWQEKTIDAPTAGMILRARDEIVELREYVKAELTVTQVLKMLQQARADALEEAANVADDACLGSSCRAIHAIRALKDKRDE